VLEHHAALDLIIEDNTCHGVYVLDLKTGVIETYRALATVLATGGCGQVYKHTTNPSIATGDGIAMAWRAGAKISNMEFIQFHPTSLFAPGARSFLISEAVRGEGGILRRADGTPFMAEYDPRKDLATRDIVARAIDAELKKSNAPCVYLDITHKDADWLKAHFPMIYSHCLTFGIDITTDRIPVVPAAHFSCGGVQTDLNGQTTINRLYACGEVACTGVHGANRLASNSLLEALVFARRAANDVARRQKSWTVASSLPDFDINALVGPDDCPPLDQLRERLRAVMHNYVGIVRSNKRLSKALAAVDALQGEAAGIFADGQITESRIELRNLLDVARLIVISAQHRRESRGLHYTIDYPQPVEEERIDTILQKT